MTLEFDHLFILTKTQAPEVDHILAHGFTEGTPNTHPGQGTANRRIFFRNAMLEFLWVVNEQDVKSSGVTPLHLWERWHHHQSGYSPFGLIFRPSTQKQEHHLPFATWAYRPPYLPPYLQIEIASNTAAVEPLLGVIPFGERPDASRVERSQPLDHACGVREITGVRISLPSNEPLSTAVAEIQSRKLVTFNPGKTHFAEIEFNGGVQKQTADFRPQLPLCLRW